MSLHDWCARLVQEKAQVAQECREIVFEASEVRPGMGVKAQKLQAHKNLGVTYLKVVRAWNGRGGPKLLQELREAHARWRSQCDGRSVAQRLERLERAIALADTQVPHLAGGEADLSRLVKSPA